MDSYRASVKAVRDANQYSRFVALAHAVTHARCGLGSASDDPTPFNFRKQADQLT